MRSYQAVRLIECTNIGYKCILSKGCLSIAQGTCFFLSDYMLISSWSDDCPTVSAVKGASAPSMT